MPRESDTLIIDAELEAEDLTPKDIEEKSFSEKRFRRGIKKALNEDLGTVIEEEEESVPETEIKRKRPVLVEDIINEETIA